MANPKWGTKRTCPSCSAHFYDLHANPAVCPKCAHAFDPTAVVKSRKGRGKKADLSISDGSEDILLKRKKSMDVGDVDLGTETFGGEIEEIDDLADIEEEIEEIDESVVKEDGDDEAIIEDLDAGAERLIDEVEDDSGDEEK